MKHIKIFEDFNEPLYKHTDREYLSSAEFVELTDSEIETIMNYDNSFENYFSLIIKNKNVTIQKIEDEWFYILDYDDNILCDTIDGVIQYLNDKYPNMSNESNIEVFKKEEFFKPLYMDEYVNYSAEEPYEDFTDSDISILNSKYGNIDIQTKNSININFGNEIFKKLVNIKKFYDEWFLVFDGGVACITSKFHTDKSYICHKCDGIDGVTKYIDSIKNYLN